MGHVRQFAGSRVHEFMGSDLSDADGAHCAGHPVTPDMIQPGLKETSAFRMSFSEPVNSKTRQPVPCPHLMSHCMRCLDLRRKPVGRSACGIIAFRTKRHEMIGEIRHQLHKHIVFTL